MKMWLAPALRLRRCGARHACQPPSGCASAVARRFCAVAVDVPVVHDSVASAHVHASFLLARLMRERTPSTLASLVAVTEEWWRVVGRVVCLPLMAADVGQLLVETAHTPASTRGRDTAALEEDALTQWEAWVWSSAPSMVPAPVVRESDDVGGAGPSDAAPQDVVSFVQFTDLLHSYTRYRGGVQWGASRGVNVTAASYHRRRYLLHPWHGVHCPVGTAQQMPYVHVLQWMLESHTASSSAPATAEELWERHRAVAPFTMSAPSSSFKALDVCCQSGHALDLLLRAGAAVVVAVDADPAALASAEATYHEYVRDGRGKRRDAVFFTRRCEGLPQPAPPPLADGGGASLAEEGGAGGGAAAAVQWTSASAAERRRRRAREEGRGYSGLSASSEATLLTGAGGTVADEDASTGPFDVVYIHPPTAVSLLPVAAATESVDVRKTVWWRALMDTAHAEGLDTSLILPCLPCTATPALARHSPLATHSGLSRAIDALRADVVGYSAAASPRGALVADGGYVVLVLPRTFDMQQLLRPEGHEAPSLADWVVAQLDGFYDLILRRRCGVHSRESPTDAARSSALLEDALLRRLQRMQPHSTGAAGADATRWAAELRRIGQEEVWHDVVVLRKSAAMSRHCAAQRADGDALGSAAAAAASAARARRRRDAAALAWEDSFEYNEYCPREVVPHTSHHWTALMPTYSYLDADFYDSPSTVRNFLAVGHATPARTELQHDSVASDAAPSRAGADGVAEAARRASGNFSTVFAQELRTRRRTKLRKLAMSPLEQQEWYIDEKLVKSGAAQLGLLNELSKWDLKDYDS